LCFTVMTLSVKSPRMKHTRLLPFALASFLMTAQAAEQKTTLYVTYTDQLDPETGLYGRRVEKGQINIEKIEFLEKNYGFSCQYWPLENFCKDHRRIVALRLKLSWSPRSVIIPTVTQNADAIVQLQCLKKALESGKVLSLEWDTPTEVKAEDIDRETIAKSVKVLFKNSLESVYLLNRSAAEAQNFCAKAAQ
jgi:hypothetical protein